MNNSRANIDATLLAQLDAAYNWAIVSSMHFRTWDGPDKVDMSDQPCLFLRRIAEEIIQTRAYGLNKYTLHYEAWIYVRTDNQDLTDNPYLQLDPIIDAIDTAILPKPPNDRNNLSGLVDNCRIVGQIFIADGMDNGQAVIRIPIDVITGI